MAEKAVAAYGDIVIIGGGCYGSYYVRQLQRGAAAGAIAWDRLLVVDRNPRCAVVDSPPAVEHTPGWATVECVAAEWDDFLDGWLPVPERGDGRPHAIVPSPLMPHLFYDYLVRRVQARWPDRAVTREGPGAPVGTPWERASPDGTTYVSHATWTCPVNCVEPRICPHTRELRSWSVPDTLEAWAAAPGGTRGGLLGPFTFHCTHRAFGVGMVDRAPIAHAEQAIMDAARTGGVRALVATASHCHGAVAVLAVAPP